MRVLAIDPASYKLGIALFDDRRLFAAATLEATGSNRLGRMSTMIDRLGHVLNFYRPDTVVIEDPLLRGRGNSIMERLKGIIEASTEILIGWPKEQSIENIIYYIHPTTVKKYMGSGSLDKLEVALAAGEMLESADEKELIADLITKEEFDATDAIAIGLSYYLKYENEAVDE